MREHLEAEIVSHPSQHARPDLWEDARPCPFCECEILWFCEHSVECDLCQAQGPPAGRFTTAKEGPERDLMFHIAVDLWNGLDPEE